MCWKDPEILRGTKGYGDEQQDAVVARPREGIVRPLTRHESLLRTPPVQWLPVHVVQTGFVGDIGESATILRPDRKGVVPLRSKPAPRLAGQVVQPHIIAVHPSDGHRHAPTVWRDARLIVRPAGRARGHLPPRAADARERGRAALCGPSV